MASCNYAWIFDIFQEKPFILPETLATFAKPSSPRNKSPSISAGSIASRKIPTEEKNFFMPPSKNNAIRLIVFCLVRT